MCLKPLVSCYVKWYGKGVGSVLNFTPLPGQTHSPFSQFSIVKDPRTIFEDPAKIWDYKIVLFVMSVPVTVLTCPLLHHIRWKLFLPLVMYKLSTGYEMVVESSTWLLIQIYLYINKEKFPNGTFIIPVHSFWWECCKIFDWDSSEQCSLNAPSPEWWMGKGLMPLLFTSFSL